MFLNQYDNDITVWSPQGRLLQLEYAEEATNHGSIAIGICGKDYAVLAVLKRSTTGMASYQDKLFIIDKQIGMCMAGISADGRKLYRIARSRSLAERKTYSRPINISKLMSELIHKAQSKTQYHGSRPYGVGLLIAGYDNKDGPQIYKLDASGMTKRYIGVSIGARSQPARTYLEKNIFIINTASIDDLILLALRTLKSSLDGDSILSIENVDVGIVGKDTEFSFINKDNLKILIENL